MKINLYRVAAPSNSVNKLAGATFVGSRELTSFNDFRYDDSSFVLGEEYDFNYVTFIGAHDILFCGYITGMVRTNGLYHYYVKNDMLEMAYQAGAFNTSVYCTHSIYGSDYLFDDRVRYNDYLSRSDKYNFPESSFTFDDQTLFVAMNVIAHPWDVGVNTNAKRMLSSEGTRTYIFPLSSFYNFSTKFETKSSKVQQAFGPSILSCSLISADLLDAQSIRVAQSRKVKIERYETVSLEDVGNTLEITLDGGHLLYYLSGVPVDRMPSENVFGRRITHDFSSNPIELYGYRKKGNFTINIRGGVQLSGTLSSLNVNRITHLGYATMVNFASNTVKYYLFLNDHIVEDVNITTNLQEVFPYGYDNTATTWQNFAGGGIGLISGIAQTAIGIATGNPFLVGSGIASGVGGISSLTQSSNEASIGGQAITGALGGTPDYACGYFGGIFFTWFSPIDLENFQDKYGKPDYHMRDLTGYHGYVRTAGARLYDPRGKLTIPDRILDTTINSEGIFIL